MSLQPDFSRYFDRYTANFDAIYGSEGGLFSGTINHLFRQDMAIRFRKTILGCQPVAGRSVLDVGCGPGHYGVALACDGASRVLGIDLAPQMISRATSRAAATGVDATCRFVVGEFLSYPLTEQFDYVIVMGFMDYASDPVPVIQRAITAATRKAFFSFPIAGGLLAWQRKLRYARRCPLYFYTRSRLIQLMSECGRPFTMECLSRDFFVTVRCDAG